MSAKPSVALVVLICHWKDDAPVAVAVSGAGESPEHTVWSPLTVAVTGTAPSIVRTRLRLEQLEEALVTVNSAQTLLGSVTVTVLLHGSKDTPVFPAPGAKVVAQTTPSQPTKSCRKIIVPATGLQMEVSIEAVGLIGQHSVAMAIPLGC